MQQIVFSVHEFMSIMGNMDEEFRATGSRPDSVFHAWQPQWQALVQKTEKMDLMDYADLLFDGKVTVNAISEAHLAEVLGVIGKLIANHERLVAEGDEDADPEDLEAWQKRAAELRKMVGGSA